MRSQELQDAYCPQAEEMTPLHQVVLTKLRGMMHTYLNGEAPAELVED
ncbi:hypothetical protein BH09PAT4_BH09PAT4_05710 [soil metagenome]